MIIRGVNSAITRERRCTILDVKELLHLMTRRERMHLIRWLETYNDDEKLEYAATRKRIAQRYTTNFR